MSDLTDVEVISVLMRNLSAADAMIATAKYKAQRSAGLYGYVACDSDVFAHATQMAERHAKRYSLRSLDILHLSTAVRVGIPTIASFDKRLRDAALALDLAVVPA